MSKTMKDIDLLRRMAREHVVQAHALMKQAKEIAEDIEMESEEEAYADSYQIGREVESLESLLGD